MSVYIINKMYTGSYLSDNIGGEVINLLYDDKDRNYVFVGKDGFINERYNDKVDAVILTRPKKAGCLEVVAIAVIGKGGQITYKKGRNAEEQLDNAVDYLNKYLDKNDVSYGGIKFKEIIDGGKSFSGVSMTFISERLLFPKEELYLTDSVNKDYEVDGAKTINVPDKRFSNQELRTYINESDNTDGYRILSELINDESLWDSDKKYKIIPNDVRDETSDKHFNILDIIHKAYDELSYSNYFAYIFKKYPDLFKKFSKEVLGVEIGDGYTIEREKDHIDILIKDDKTTIVIENKIKSGINGVPINQTPSKDNPVKSQLSDYYKIYKDEAKYFIFLPDYSKLNLDKYKYGDKYVICRYSEIYKFYKVQGIDDIYYKEFVNALYKHTKDRELDYAEDMKKKFIKRIKAKKKAIDKKGA